MTDCVVTINCAQCHSDTEKKMYLSCCLVEPRTLEHEYYCFNLFSQSQHNKHTLLRFVRLSFLTFLNRISMYLLSFYSILFIRYRCQRNSIIRQCRLQNICSFKPLAQSFAQRRPEAGEPSNWIEIEINWLTPDPLLMLSLLYQTVDIIKTKPPGKKSANEETLFKN